MPPKKKKTQPGDGAESFYLEHTTDGHNKFYLMWIEAGAGAFFVHINYGPIGADGSFSKHTYTTESDAKNFVNRQLTSKLAKGYKMKERKNKKLPTPEASVSRTKASGEFARFTKMALDW